MAADKALLDEAGGQITAIGQLNEAVKAISVENFFPGGVNRKSFTPELFVDEFLDNPTDRDRFFASDPAEITGLIRDPALLVFVAITQGTLGSIHKVETHHELVEA